MTALEVPLDTMPLSERVALLKRIQQTLPPLTPEDEDKVDMPDWHAGVLEERLKKVQEGRARWYTLEEVEERRARRKP